MSEGSETVLINKEFFLSHMSGDVLKTLRSTVRTLENYTSTIHNSSTCPKRQTHYKYGLVDRCFTSNNIQCVKTSTDVVVKVILWRLLNNIGELRCGKDHHRTLTDT